MILTVVIAAKDAPERLLRCCLASFARLRAAPELEIVIVNSGTFPEEGRKLAAQFGDFRLIEMPPQGVYAAYNRGIVEARSRYVIFFGVDDIALPGMDSVVDMLAASDTCYDLFAASSYMQGIGISAPARARSAILFRNWCHQGLFYRRDYLNAHPFDVTYRLQADHKANIEIVADKRLVVGRSHELVSYFSTGGASQTAFDTKFRNDLPAIARANFGRGLELAVIAKQRLANLIKGRPDQRG